MAPDGVPQRARRQLPVGLRLFAQFGDGQRAAQRVVDGGTAGQQRVLGVRAVLVAAPADLPAGLLEGEHELDRRVDDGPHPLQERVVAGGEVVVPDADGDVGDEVGLPAAVGDVGEVPVGVGGVPGAVRVLVPGQPRVGPPGGLVFVGGVQGHGRLDVVPRVEVVPAEPGDRPVLALHGEDAADGRGGLGVGEDARQDEVLGTGGAGRARGGHAASTAGRCGLVA